MRREIAIGCIVAGIPIAIIDAWLSMQAMFGILDPRNFLSYTVAIFGGIFFTAFLVLSEASGKRKEWFGNASKKLKEIIIMLVLISIDKVTRIMRWLVLFSVDTGTSILCAIWYGLLGNPFNRRIEVDQIKFDPNNWPLTSIYVVFVIVSLGCCILLGRAFESMLEKENSVAG